MAVAEYVEDGAAVGEMPRLIHIVHFLKVVFPQPFDDIGGVDGRFQVKMQGMVGDYLWRSHSFGEGVRVGDHDFHGAVSGVPGPECFRAQYLRRRVGLTIFDGSLVA